MREQQHHIVGQSALSQRTQVAIVIAAAMIIGWPIAAYGLKTSSLFRGSNSMFSAHHYRRIPANDSEHHGDRTTCFICVRVAPTSSATQRDCWSRSTACEPFTDGEVRLVPNGMLWRAGGHHAVRLELADSVDISTLALQTVQAFASAINERLSAG